MVTTALRQLAPTRELHYDAPIGALQNDANAAVVFKCTWPGCLEIKATVALIEEHVRQSHLGPKKSECDSEDDMSVHEEEFYYQEVAVDHMSSPPTMSHRDMARPPHEDPEYQKQLRLEAVPTASSYIENVIVGVREPSNTFTISQSPVGYAQQAHQIIPAAIASMSSTKHDSDHGQAVLPAANAQRC
ncbi:putative zinc finger protein 395 [Lasius niger]|uniref:Putative zinc finger protein 395 n=1 Tax=Lasius niger TaxID=67767 RepID=A0A0J7KSD9_LASNI|nr:putative zinc finger protein 395 [Lasius niger]